MQHVQESFRSEYAVNPDYVAELEGAGALFSADGFSGDRRFAAALEWRSAPFFAGVAYLPQFGSRPGAPHPLFEALVDRAL